MWFVGQEKSGHGSMEQRLSSPGMLKLEALVFGEHRYIRPNEAIPAIVFAASEASAVLPPAGASKRRNRCRKQQRKQEKRRDERRDEQNRRLE